MPAPEVFAWGSAGGAIVAIILYVLPELLHGLATKKFDLTWAIFGLMFAVTVLLATIAGVISLVPHVADRGQAITAGMGVQTLLRGVVGAVQTGIGKPALNAP